MQISKVAGVSSEDTFKHFLVRAKVQTYAAEQPQKRTLPDGGLELEFEEGDLLYRDRYYGGILFHGQEVVFIHGEPKWSMVYYGYTPDAKEPSPMAIDTLKLALRSVTVDSPYRGPAQVVHEGIGYECTHTGTLGRFEGEETIKRGDDLLIRLVFAGGWIL